MKEKKQNEKKDIKFDLSTRSFTISDLCFWLPSLQVGVDRLVYHFRCELNEHVRLYE